MAVRVSFAIENFEEISEWVLLEYRHASRLAGKGRLTICGAPAKLRKIARAERRHSWQMKLPDPILLDPAAPEILEPDDFSDGENFVVIGGICGDWPAKGRTGNLLSSRFPGARLRSLGGLQLSIDSALWTAREIAKGRPLSRIPFVQRAEIPLGDGEIVKLNFGYPLVKGEPLVTPGLANLLSNRKLF